MPRAAAPALAAPPVAAPGTPACPPRPSRQVRRAATRQAHRHARRRARHPDLAPPPPGPDGLPPWATGAPAARPTYAAVLGWLEALLGGRGHSRPTVKRLALLGAALVATDGERGTPAGVAHTAFGLGIGTATQEASVARRVARLLDDPHLDPQRLLPDLARAVLPVLLAEVGRAHGHTIGTRPAHASHAGHHGRWVGVRVVVDATTKGDEAHVLTVSLAYRGVAVPLGVRTWPQNRPQPEGAYWAALGGLLLEVHAALPPALRPHVCVLADRGYGVPAFLDLLAALGWQWVVRVQGQARVLFPDGTSRPLRALVARPGDCWCGQATPLPDGAAGAPVPIVGVFRKAGGRGAHVVAVWAVGEAEPWLLVTSRPATPARGREYARRWGIERLFLAWKSHGWDLEATGVTDPARLGRLLVGYVVATWWLLAAALPGAQAHLAELATRAARRTGRPPARPTQLRLRLSPLARPWVAKVSLLTQGRQAFARVDCRTATPALCWAFPAWDAPVWSQQCLDTYHARAC